MRVLEQKPVLTQTMGKKKHKLRKHSKENANFPTDSSDESHQGAAGPRCSHLSKSVNINSVRKALKQLGSLSVCTSCSREATITKKVQDAPDASDLVNGGSCEDLMLEAPEPTLWACLQCGHLGCDRNSKEKHGLKHYQTPRSASHAVVVNINTWIVWCYSCDDECPVDSTSKLREAVELLRRLASGDIVHTPSGRKGSISRAEIPITVAEIAGEVPSKETEEKEKSKVGNKNKLLTSNPFVGIPLPKVYGLSNLGNTCFFNAVMQNLSHTYILRDLLTEYGDRGLNICLAGSERYNSDSESSGSSWTDEEPDEKSLMDPLNLTLPECGALTKSMVGFLGEMKLGNDTLRSASNNIVNPGRLFGQICKKTPRFKGFQQQDSHELLRHLLEGMKGEEIKRSQAAILKAFNLENVQAKKVDEDTKQKVKEYGRQVKHTFVDSVFGGYFISTVLCEECHMPSQVFEPFQDISLPILEEKPTRPNSLGGARKKYEPETKTKSPEPVMTGVDGFAASNRPSKHTSRKSKKQAKKEAKRKTKNKGKNVLDTSVDQDDEKEEGENDEKEGDEEEKEGEKRKEEENDKSDQQKEGSGSNEEWDSKSDADVEDNIESDVSRKRGLSNGMQSIDDLRLDRFSPSQCMNCQKESEKSKPGSPVNNTSETCKTNGALEEDNTSTVRDSQRTNSPNGDTDGVGALEDGLRTMSLEGRKSPSEAPAECVMNGVVNHEDGLNGCTTGDTQEERKSSSSPDPAKSPKASRPNISKSEQTRDAKLKAMQTLSARNQPAAHECSIMSCLNQFTAGELLTGNNKFGCERCTRNKYNNQDSEGKRETVYTNASKQCLIFIPPAILTLHLKRFQQVGFSLRKVNRHVDFPLELDLASYCSALSLGVRPGQSSIRYSLYGVVEHSGRLTGGHYTAYVKVRSGNSELKKFLQFYDINGLQLRKVLEMMKTRTPFFNDKAKDDEAASPAPGRWYYMSDTRVSEASESSVLRCQAYLLFYERIQ